MNRSRRILIVVVVLLLVASFLPAGWARTISRGPREIVVVALRPAELLREIGDSVRGQPRAEIDRPDDRALQDLYDEALQINENLRARLDIAGKRIEHLSNIRQTYGLEQVQLLSARVLTAGGIGDAAPLTIDKGRSDGVGAGYAVTHGIHLIGRVVDASPQRASVRPITVPGTHLSVTIKPPVPDTQRSPAPVLIKAVEGGRFTAVVDVSDGVAVGDLAHLHHRDWPAEAQGFVVGRVSEVVKDEKNPLLTRIVTVEPYHRPAAVRDVVVLVPFATEE